MQLQQQPNKQIESTHTLVTEAAEQLPRQAYGASSAGVRPWTMHVTQSTIFKTLSGIACWSTTAIFALSYFPLYYTAVVLSLACAISVLAVACVALHSIHNQVSTDQRLYWILAGILLAPVVLPLYWYTQIRTTPMKPNKSL